MQKIQDIHKDELTPSIDTRDPERVISPQIDTNTQEHIQDIKAGNGSIISLAKEYPIHVEKKKGKHFDALEQKSAFSKIFLMRDISLKTKNKSYSISSTIWYRVSKIFWYIKQLSSLTIILVSIAFIWVYWAASKLIIENRVNAWYQKLLGIRENTQGLDAIQRDINNARFDLLLADILFTPFALLWGERIDSVARVISGWRYLSRWLDDSLALYTHTNKYVDSKDLKNIYFTQLLLNVSPNLLSIEKSLRSALDEYSEISWLPNENLWEQKNIGQDFIAQLLSKTSELNNNFPEFLNMLGHESRKRYLIVFQNADEIRPTGWFMWSMGLLEVFRWKVQLFQKKDVYAIEWDLKSVEYDRLPAPKWISELTDTFGLRDANYFANIWDSSNAIKFFTDRAGIRLDGIIYINQNTLLHLLEDTGPIYFPPLEREITSENFSELMSLAVEAKTFKVWTLGTPKQVLFDFIQVFIAELNAQWTYFDYAQTLFHDVASRDIVLWSFDDDHNNLLSDFWLNWDIDYSKSLDYLYPVYTSLSGNKSDRYMKRNYVINVASQPDSCNYNVSFQIRSTHAMTQSRRDDIQNFIQEYQLDSPNLFEIQGAARNRQYVRAIIPPYTTTIPQEWTDIVDYGSRKWFEFFLDTQLSQTSLYENEYILENPKCENYSTTLYKQAGIPEYSVRLNIDGEIFNYDNLQEDFYFEVRR